MIYSEATDALARFAEATGIAGRSKRMAGKGALPFDHPQALGAIGVTGTPGAEPARPRRRPGDRRRLAAERLHHRVEDRVPAPGRAVHQHQRHRVRRRQARGAAAGRRCARDARGVAAADGRAGGPSARVSRARRRREGRLGRARSIAIYAVRARAGPQPGRGDRRRQRVRRRRATSSCARPAACRATCTSCGARATPSSYHLEYGYSCMGYEIAGGLGVKMAAPDREVYVLVGDGSYLMMAQEIVDRRSGRRPAHHRAARQPRLRQHRRPVARRSAAPASAPSTAIATRRPGSSTASCCRSTSPPTPRRSART